MSRPQRIYCREGYFSISSVVCSQYNDWFCTVISTSQAYIMRQGCLSVEKNQQHVADSDKMMHEAHRKDFMCVWMQKKKYLSVTFNLIYQCPHKCYSLQQSCRQTTLDIKMVQQAIYSMLSVTNILRVFLCFCVCVCEREPMSTFKGIKHPTVSVLSALISTSCPGTPVSTLRYANEGGGILLSDHYHALPCAYLHINPSST